MLWSLWDRWRVYAAGMPRGRIDREDRYEATGMTTMQREQVIARLHKKGLSQHKIAAKLGITQPAVHYTLLKLSGQQRNRAKYDICDWCDKNVPKGALDANGCCEECAEG
jgi:hypothetical protein